MANLIILEGLSRTGKTSISSQLTIDKFGRIISLSRKRPSNCDVTSFYKGVGEISNSFYAAFPGETFILDRSFLSEMVYSEFFGRRSSIDDEYMKDLLSNNNILQFYLHNTHEDYLSRKPKDEYIYTEKDYENLKDLFSSKITKFEVPTISIDTSEFDLYRVYKKIVNKIIHEKTSNCNWQ